MTRVIEMCSQYLGPIGAIECITSYQNRCSEFRHFHLCADNIRSSFALMIFDHITIENRPRTLELAYFRSFIVNCDLWLGINMKWEQSCFHGVFAPHWLHHITQALFYSNTHERTFCTNFPSIGHSSKIPWQPIMEKSFFRRHGPRILVGAYGFFDSNYCEQQRLFVLFDARPFEKSGEK